MHEAEIAAGAVCECDFGSFDLAIAEPASELPNSLDYKEDAAHARVIRGEAASVGIDGELAAEGDATVLDEAASLAHFAKA
jgi:hypothetical protein